MVKKIHAKVLLFLCGPTFTYSYDNRGNITKIVETIEDTTYTKKYEYTSANQLAKEIDEVQGKTIFYTYDGAGNLVKKEIFKGTGSLEDDLVTASTDSTLTQAEEADLTAPLTTIEYTYGNETWGDLLTNYNGTTIYYDKAGNPTGYLNGLKFNWSQGRQLSRVYTIRGTVATYQYNTDGIRIGKNVGGVQTEYFLDASGTMQALKQRTQKLVFFYDSTGRREGFSYYVDDTLKGHYYYLYNIQGDVRAILDSNFEAVVLYDYNSWGQPLSTTGELAKTLGVLNPFRYRGYIYDEETGLYYLNSRYYDPVVGRFINADGYVSTGQGVLGYNMFAYCLNNPVNRFDDTGCMSQTKTQELTLNSTYDGMSIAASAALIYTISQMVQQTEATVIIGNGIGRKSLNQETKAKDETKAEEISIVLADKQYNYWAAMLDKGFVRAIAPLTYTEAQAWVASGNDLLCRNHAAAIGIVKFWPSSFWEGRHGCASSGFLNHYHLSSAHGNHIWYFGE